MDKKNFVVKLPDRRAITNIEKVVFLGEYPEKFPTRSGGEIVRNMPIFCKVKFEAGKLSITGVIAPTANGDAWGSCGQIYDEITENLDRIEWAKGWDKVKAFQFVENWKRWHLNDMRAGCEHQRAQGWGDDQITIITYRLKYEITRQQNKIQEDSTEQLKATGKAQITKKQAEVLALSWEVKADKNPNADYYEEHSRETKGAGWVYPNEHPAGVLTKACPVCGYEYGSAWKFEEVPQAIIKSLDELPESERRPAWV